MQVPLSISFKRMLTILGSKISAQNLQKLQGVVNYMKVGRWMVDNQFIISERKLFRHPVYDVVADRVRSARVLYLEFGVHEGASMKYWAKALKHKDANLHGFDSFVGLPEDYDELKKGYFDVGGKYLTSTITV